jgi:hypothetical protein
VERPGRKVRFARLIQRPVRVLGGPAVRAAFGDNLKPALIATQGDTAGMGLVEVNTPEAKGFPLSQLTASPCCVLTTTPDLAGPAGQSQNDPQHLTSPAHVLGQRLLPLGVEMALCAE